jgi:hypothetical protein
MSNSLCQEVNADVIQLPPLWFTGKLPDDALLFNDEWQTSEYIRASADILIINATDPETTIWFNDLEIHIGTQEIRVLERLLVFATLKVKSSAPFRCRHYLSETCYLLTRLKINFVFNDRLYAYAIGIMGETANPINGTYISEYDYNVEETGNLDGDVYAWDVQILQTHPRMGDFCLDWTKDFVFQSAPIRVSLPERLEKEFRAWVKSVLTDSKIRLQRSLKRTRRDEPEKVRALAQEFLDQLETLVGEGILTRTNPQKILA